MIIKEKWVVLQEPNKLLAQYYVWHELYYTKVPNVGFVSKTSAEAICVKLNHKP